MKRFPENTPVGRYKVQRFIKEGAYNGSYLVYSESGEPFFMKIFDLDAVPERLRVDGSVEEILHCRRISHPNIISYVDDGALSLEGKTYPYIITPFFRGHLLSEDLKSGRVFDPEEARTIILPVLRGLDYLHRSLNLCHNDITPQNILLEAQEDGSLIPKIIDLGHMHTSVMGAPPFPVEDLHVLYMAPEALKGIFSPAGDIFAAMAVLYHLCTGSAPWTCNTTKHEPFAERKIKVRKAREQELLLPGQLDATLREALQAVLTGSPDGRPDALTLYRTLSGEDMPREETPAPEKTGSRKESFQISRNTPGKGGFADVAGMDALKQDLQKRVIWVLREKEKAERYRLTPPNGMILYGPPGCGKTFFAQKFAEESGFNYILVNGSDLGSIYVHGTQNKIADLFKEAEKNAPTVLCFDEFDSFVPSRGSDSASHRADEVNEFLSQLNNCSQRGIFVIGTTNRLDMIDPAVLRKGRMDLQVEIPAPDEETRRKMFQIHLKGRPQEENIDLDLLARATDGYASSDIAFLVNEAAMVAALSDEPISTRHLEDSVKNNPSSLPKEQKHTKIGF